MQCTEEKQAESFVYLNQLQIVVRQLQKDFKVTVLHHIAFCKLTEKSVYCDKNCVKRTVISGKKKC